MKVVGFVICWFSGFLFAFGVTVLLYNHGVLVPVTSGYGVKIP